MPILGPPRFQQFDCPVRVRSTKVKGIPAVLTFAGEGIPDAGTKQRSATCLNTHKGVLHGYLVGLEYRQPHPQVPLPEQPQIMSTAIDLASEVSKYSVRFLTQFPPHPDEDDDDF